MRGKCLESVKSINECNSKLIQKSRVSIYSSNIFSNSTPQPTTLKH